MHYQKLSQLMVNISYDILIDFPQIINDVLFVVHICIRSIDILTSLMISCVVLMHLTFTLPKNYFQLLFNYKDIEFKL